MSIMHKEERKGAVTLAKFLWNSHRSLFHTKQLSIGHLQVTNLNPLWNLCEEIFHPYAKFLVMRIPINITDFACENLLNNCKCNNTLMVNTSIQKLIVSLQYTLQFLYIKSVAK